MIWAYLSTFALLFVGLLLMVVILLQRGRGGGLAGAFGGMGGQSAFGTKAGDVFTRITVVLAVIWIALAGMSIWALEKAAQGKYQQEVPQEATPPTAPGTGAAPGGATAPSSEQPAGSGETTGAGQSSGGSASEPTSSSQTGGAVQPSPSATPSSSSSDQTGGAASQTLSPETATGTKGKSE